MHVKIEVEDCNSLIISGGLFSKKIQESCPRLKFTRHQLFLDESNMGYAVNFITEVYCPWNFYHIGVNHHLSPAFPNYLTTVSKSNHLKLIKYNLQRRWYLDDGCYMIYLIILYKLILYIYIHRKLVDFFLN